MNASHAQVLLVTYYLRRLDDGPCRISVVDA